MRGLLVVMLAGCAGVAAAPPPPVAAVHQPLGTPLAIPGESMVYEIAFRGLRVARVQVAVGQPGWVDGQRAIIVKSRGVTDGIVALLGDLDWQLETTIDLERGTPLRTTEEAVVTFRGKTERHRDDTTSPTHTVHSAVTVLRGWRSAPGQAAQLELRIADARMGVELHDAAREFLDETGKPAVRYDGVARSKFPFKIWLSDDTARVPLRVETSTKWGAIEVELVEYDAPRD